MLTELRIQNFKSWRDTKPIRLAPLTVFFGTNSSGKSSINQLLLMLKQTAQSPDRQRVLHPGGPETSVDLGTFQELLHCPTSRRNRASGMMQFTLTWTLPERTSMDVKDVITEVVYSGETLRFEAAIELLKGRTQTIVLRRMAYRLGSIADHGFEIGMERTGPNDYKLVSQKFRPVPVRREKTPDLPSPLRFYGFPATVPAHYQNADFVHDLTLELEHCLHDIYYLAPLRAVPRRAYTWSGENPEHVGDHGERTVDAILAARTRQLGMPSHPSPTRFEVVVARWLKAMGLIQRFHVRRMGPRRRDYEVLVKTRATCTEVALTDVGFGVSQVLPVIVECFYAPPGSTIIIEQPEVHLHPSVQASLADLFIDAIAASQDGKQRDIQLIVESHSEHFLRRLQLRIAQEKIEPGRTALYFCESESDGSRMIPLDVDAYGNILNWPRDFFGDPMTDLVEMNEATTRRSRRAAAK